MDVLGMLAVAPPPPAWVRERHPPARGRRASGRYPPGRRTAEAPLPSQVPQAEVGQWLASAKNGRRRMSFGQLVPRWALVAASAAVLLVSGLVGWGYEQRNGNAVIAG